jgi:hypothetical protein
MTSSADQKLHLWDLFNKAKARSQKENKSVLRLFSSNLAESKNPNGILEGVILKYITFTIMITTILCIMWCMLKYHLIV